MQTELFSIENWEESFKEKRNDLLENAAVIPADFREKLRLYLESQQEGFKVGGFSLRKRKLKRKSNDALRMSMTSIKPSYNRKSSVI